MWVCSHDYVCMFHRAILIQKHDTDRKCTTKISVTDRACMLLSIAMK